MRIKTVNPTAWYDIPGYDGKYQINYYGAIRRTLKKGWRELRPYKKKSNGRSAVKLNYKEMEVKKLMQITFLGDIPEGTVTYHKNGILTDNALNNIGIITREELGRLTGRRNRSETSVVKISKEGKIVDFYRSVREAGRKNYMSYQTISDRIKGKCKSLYAPDGYLYCKDTESEINKAIRRIELDRKEECSVDFIQAPDVTFDF